ncbi:unnamed protein product, partial [Polarella glacialis]
GKAIIVPSAAVAGGYPDLLTFLCAKKIREDHGEELRRAVCYCRGGGSSAGASGGTLATRAAMSSASDEVRKLMADPFALGGFIPEVDKNGIKDCLIQSGTGKMSLKGRKEDMDAVLSKVSQCPHTGIWRAPWMYSYFDTRVVRRSNALLADLSNQPYGRNFNFQEFMMLPPEIAHQLASGMPAKPVGPSASSEKELLEQQGRYFAQGSGPELEDIEDAWMGFFMWAESTSGRQVKCSLVGADGYFETARCAVEMAMTLRFDKEQLPFQGGVLNAAVAGQTWYAQRLIASGVKFKMGDWFSEEDCVPPPH